MSRHYIDESPLAEVEAIPYCRKHSGMTIMEDGQVVRYWDDCDCAAPTPPQRVKVEDE